MTYREFQPHPALRPYVDRFWIGSAEADAPPRHILPDGCIDLMMDCARGGSVVAVGTMTHAIVFHPRARVRTAAVRFRPGGAAPFLGLPAAELTDRVIAGDDIGLGWLKREPRLRRRHGLAVEAAEAFESGAGLTDVIRALERLMLERLRAIPRPDPLVAHAVSSLFGSAPPTIEALGHDIGWSRQYLGRVFRRHVGVGPKLLARVARLHRAVDRLQRAQPQRAQPQRATASGGRDIVGGGGDVVVAGGGISLAATAADLGYFDQAHMARDFRELAGVTPLSARTGAGSIFPIPSLFTGA